MILSHDGEWLFVSTRKCATNTLYKALEGKRIQNGGFHPRPNERMAPLHFTVVRNPYDRAVSIWASTCLRGHDKYGARNHIRQNGGNPDQFIDFCDSCLLQSFPTRDPWLFRNQSSWLDTFIWDNALSFETLGDDLASIGIEVELPHLNQSKHPHWAELMTDESVRVIEHWAAFDFERFGYEKL